MQNRRTTLLLFAVGAAFLLSAAAFASHEHSASGPSGLCPACVHAGVSTVISDTIVIHQLLRAHLVAAAACTPPVVQAVFTASPRGPPLTIE